MKNARPIVFFKLAFGQPTRHLHTHAEHGFGHLYVLTLKKSLGIFREVQRHQRPLVFSPTQLDTAVWQFDNFKKGRWHKSLFSTKARDYISHPVENSQDLQRFALQTDE